jgi:hypothetical protein
MWCSEVCIAMCYTCIPKWSASRKVSSRRSKQVCSWWHWRMLFAERDQIWCYFIPSITCSSNPKASLNCHNLWYFHFNDVISYGIPECDPMSTELYSITSQVTNLISTLRTSTLSYSPCMWQDFSLRVPCPFNIHNDRNVQTVVQNPNAQ